MEAAQKQMAEHQNGPLTHISSTQGFFPYKKFATEEEQSQILKSIEDSLDKVTPFQRKQYERTIEHLKDDKSANLQLVLVPATAGYEKGVEDQAYLFPPHTPGTPMAITAAMCLQYPLSRGTVHIKSSDPNELPTVDPAFLSHPADAAVLAAGVKVRSKGATCTNAVADLISHRCATRQPNRSISRARSQSASSLRPIKIFKTPSKPEMLFTILCCPSIIVVAALHWATLLTADLSSRAQGISELLTHRCSRITFPAISCRRCMLLRRRLLIVSIANDYQSVRARC